jgi:hypothetical protein
MSYHTGPQAEDDRLYLVVNASIQELRDDEEDNNVLETENTEAATVDS